jgi:hypothetical protein
MKDGFCYHCGKKYTGAFYARSRRDPSKKLCPTCGQAEALGDMKEHHKKSKGNLFGTGGY